MSIAKSVYGVLNDGKEIEKYTLKNKSGVSVSIITYGATVTNIFAPGKDGFKDVLVGFDNLDGFLNRSNYQGQTIGPYANRIGGASFSLDGVKYNLVANEKGVTALHGGGEFNKATWKAEILSQNTALFSYLSPDMTGGFPGNLDVKVAFTLTDENELIIEYRAVSDKKTVINLTNHAYFNLGGFDGGDILDHEIKINASFYTPVDKLSIPTGAVESVENTPFDFREYKRIGDEIDKDAEQLNFTGGYDHNFCIDGYDGTLKECAKVRDRKSGRTLEVFTTLPGVQFYSGNFLSGKIGKNSVPMEKRTGFCLETQYYPDSPNKPSFPSCVFAAGEVYNSKTIYKFGAE